MEILKYSEDHNRFRNRLRKLLEIEVAPHIDQWDKELLIPKPVWQKMGQEGFLCMSVAPEYGGQGLDFLYSVIVIEEVARINYFSFFIHLHSDIVVPYIDSYASHELKKKYLPGCVSGDIITAVAMTEPGAGSDLASIATTAVEEGDEIVLNGSKTFISNGVNCDLVVVAARNPQEENPYSAISLYLVEAGIPGFKKGKQLAKMGMHSQDTAELFFTNCRIPAKNILGQKGGGFLMLMEKLQQERLICAVGGIWSAKSILDYTLDYFKSRIGEEKSIARSQAAQFAFAEMSTQVSLGQTFVDNLVVRHMEKEQVVTETCMAKYWTTDLAKDIAGRCIDLLGDFGAMESCPVAKVYKDIRVMPIFAGTNEIMKGIIAKSLGF